MQVVIAALNKASMWALGREKWSDALYRVEGYMTYHLTILRNVDQQK